MEEIKFLCSMWFCGNVEIFDQSQTACCLFVVQLVLYMYTERNHSFSAVCGSLDMGISLISHRRPVGLFVVQLALYTGEMIEFLCCVLFHGNVEIFDQSHKACCLFVVQVTLYTGRNRSFFAV